MQKKLEITQPSPTKFKVLDSNYRVVTSFKDEHIIESWQFAKLLPMLNNDKIDFISINDTLINKRFIQSIEPTERRTLEQDAMDRKNLKFY